MTIAKVESLLRPLVIMHLTLTVSTLCTLNLFITATDNRHARSGKGDAADGIAIEAMVTFTHPHQTECN